MPSTYAHYRFGCRTFDLLPEDLKEIISRNRSCYDIGQHGPDILFYYKPLRSNPTKQLGYDMHGMYGKELFSRFAALLHEHPDDEPLASYLTGFVCHYALDSHCHSYIENKIRQSGVDHVSIEAALDRYLLLADGRKPLGGSIAEHIVPGDDISRAASLVFEGVSPEDINKALSSFKSYDDLLGTSNPLVRGFIIFALRLTGNYEDKHGLLMPKGQIPGTSDSNLRLLKLFDSALTDAPGMIESFFNAAKDGKEIDDPRFEGSFGPRPGWEEIPVLSYEEELSYQLPDA